MLKFIFLEITGLLNIYKRIKYVSSQRDKPILFLDSYKYRKEKERGNCDYWRCLTNGCRGRIIMKNSNVFKYSSYHNHKSFIL